MKVLVIAPHADDEVLGCGGIIAKYAKEGNDVYVAIVTKASAPLYSEDDDVLDRAQAKKAHKILGVKETIYLDLPAAMLDTIPRYKLNGAISKLINKVKPDEVYIPHRGDMHIDHKLVNEACMVALRPRNKENVSRVYAYETLSETEWDIQNSTNTFIPNVYVDISKYINKKVKAMEAYSSQICEYPNPRSKEGITSLAMTRGMSVNYKFAESFMLIREIKK